NLELSITEASSYEASFGFSAYTINWGDGTRTVSPADASASGYAVTHTYAHQGIYVISALVTEAANGDHGFSQVLAALSDDAHAAITVSGQDANPGTNQAEVIVTGSALGTQIALRPSLVYVTGLTGPHSFTVNFGDFLTAPIAIFGSGSDTL